MPRTVPLWLSPLPFVLFALFLLLSMSVCASRVTLVWESCRAAQREGVRLEVQSCSNNMRKHYECSVAKDRGFGASVEKVLRAALAQHQK